MKGLKLFKIGKSDNPFVSILKLLNVKFTHVYSNKYFHEHPYKYSLLGLSKMLTDYGIENAGIRIENKEQDIFNIKTPFIAHVGGDFVVVYKITSTEIYYNLNSKSISESIQKFCWSWSGIILLVEKSPTAIEPDYLIHRKQGLCENLKKTFWLLSIITLLVLTVSINDLYYAPSSILILLINLLGIFTCVLLLSKQMNINNKYTDKICSLLKQGDCNSILESEYSKFFGVTWSEIGLSYFISNFLILFVVSQLIFYYAIISVLVLPYTLWNIWCQKVKFKQWCPLCLVVQILLWIQFVLIYCFGYIKLPIFNFIDLLFVGCIYLIPFLSISLIIPLLNRRKVIEQITQEVNSIKANELIFVYLLKQQSFYEIDKTSSKIIWGNINSKFLITIITNPHCNPCAKLDKRIDDLYGKLGDEVCFQYILTAFNDDLIISNKFLISIYFNNDINLSREIFKEWFEEGKNERDKFMKKYANIPIKDNIVETEFANHLKWVKKNRITGTPTILINGYQLPSNYKIEDLVFLTSSDIR